MPENAANWPSFENLLLLSPAERVTHSARVYRSTKPSFYANGTEPIFGISKYVMAQPFLCSLNTHYLSRSQSRSSSMSSTAGSDGHNIDL
jgi:hypothetical protein